MLRYLIIALLVVAFSEAVASASVYWSDWEGANNVWNAGLDGSNPMQVGVRR